MNQRKTSHTIVWKTYAHRLAGQPGCSPGCELHRASCPMPLACCSRQFYQHSSLGCLKSPLGLKEDLIQGTRSIFSCSLFLKSFQFSLDKALRLSLLRDTPQVPMSQQPASASPAFLVNLCLLLLPQSIYLTILTVSFFTSIIPGVCSLLQLSKARFKDPTLLPSCLARAQQTQWGWRAATQTSQNMQRADSTLNRGEFTAARAGESSKPHIA